MTDDLEERVKSLEEKMQNIVGWIESTGGVVDNHTDRIQALEIKRENFDMVIFSFVKLYQFYLFEAFHLILFDKKLHVCLLIETLILLLFG